MPKFARIVGSLLLTLMFLLMPALQPGIASSQVREGATLTVLRGQVAVVRPDGSAVQPAPSGTTVNAGDELRTISKAGALITFFSGTEIEMGDETILIVERVTQNGNRVDVSLKQVLGVTVNRVQAFSDPGSSYRIEAGGATALVRGTTFALIGPVATSQGNIVSLVCLDDCTPATTFSGCPVAAYTGFGVTVEGGRVTSGCETFGVSRGSDIWNAAFEAITTFEQSFAQGNNVNNPGSANLGRERGTVRSEERAREQNQEQGDNKQPTSGTVGPVQGTGVNGLVTNARNARAISGATVQVDGTTAATTGSDGRFTLATSTTSRVVRVSAPGFVTSTRTVPATTTELVISLVPISSTDDIIIVLNWGAQPRDLDAHISGPDRAAGRFHVFFANPRAPLPSPYAILDVDDVSSFGPETITISRDPTTGLFRAGEYRYWVHNFSGSPGFDVSGAQVTIVKGSNQVAEFNVSDSSGNPSLPIWRVANLTVDTAGNVTVTPVRTFTSGSSSSIFTIPSGSGEGVDSFGIDDGSPAAPTEK